MPTDEPIPPLRAAILAQVFGALIAAGLAALAYPKLLSQPLTLALLQGVAAAFTSHKLDAPPWWLPIHLAFMPLVVLARGLELAPAWYLGAFLVLLLVFWRVDRSRVPLYLSNWETAAAVAALLPRGACRVADLGCGTGGLLRTLAQMRPDCQFLGVEHAPVPWLWARLACMGSPNCRIIRGDFWRWSLADFDLVYAFLSPTPMARLWLKAQREMKAGALLVSNSFAVPNARAARMIDIEDARATQLYCYRPSEPGSQ